MYSLSHSDFSLLFFKGYWYLLKNYYTNYCTWNVIALSWVSVLCFGRTFLPYMDYQYLHRVKDAVIIL